MIAIFDRWEVFPHLGLDLKAPELAQQFRLRIKTFAARSDTPCCVNDLGLVPSLCVDVVRLSISFRLISGNAKNREIVRVDASDREGRGDRLRYGRFTVPLSRAGLTYG